MKSPIKIWGVLKCHSWKISSFVGKQLANVHDKELCSHLLDALFLLRKAIFETDVKKCLKRHNRIFFVLENLNKNSEA